MTQRTRERIESLEVAIKNLRASRLNDLVYPLCTKADEVDRRLELLFDYLDLEEVREPQKTILRKRKKGEKK